MLYKVVDRKWLLSIVQVAVLCFKYRDTMWLETYISIRKLYR